jgi:hypothetical protein
MTTSETLVSPEQQAGTTCPSCGSDHVRIERCESGPHWSVVTCLECHAKNFGKTPWTLDRARAFVLRYGKFRGIPLGELATTHEGRSYLSWLSRETGGNAAIAAGLLMGEISAAGHAPVETNESSCSDLTSHQKRNPDASNAGTSSNARDYGDPSGGTDPNAEGRSIHVSV